MTTNPPPVAKIRDGNIYASIWKNFGDKGAFYSVTWGRTYTDEADKAQSSDSFSQSDLLRQGQLIPKVYDKISELRALDQSAADQAAA